MHMFDAPSKSVLSRLIITCTPALTCSVREQSPWKISLISSLEPHFALRTAVLTRLVRKIETAVTEQVSSTTSLLECHIRNVWALRCSGSDSGNQGLRSFKVANRASASSPLVTTAAKAGSFCCSSDGMPVRGLGRSLLDLVEGLRKLKEGVTFHLEQ